MGYIHKHAYIERGREEQAREGARENKMGLGMVREGGGEGGVERLEIKKSIEQQQRRCQAEQREFSNSRIRTAFVGYQLSVFEKQNRDVNMNIPDISSRFRCARRSGDFSILLLLEAG